MDDESVAFKIRKRKIAASIIMVAASAVLTLNLWPYETIGAGYAAIQNSTIYDSYKQRTKTMDWYQDDGGSAVIFNYENGDRQMLHDGYPSLYFDTNNGGVIQEQMTGAALPSLLPIQKRENALIIGYGTGITVGTAGKLFQSVKVYEVREAMLKMAEEEFSYANYQASEQDNIKIVIQDGIVGLAREKDLYSGIYINIPSPGIRGTEKLYSKEVMELVKSKLKPSGKVFFWLHSIQGKDVLQVLLNNIRGELSPCRFFYLNGDYYQVICSPGETPEEFLNATINDLDLISATGHDLGYLTRISEFKMSETISPKEKKTFHTLDHPWFDTRALFTGILGDSANTSLITVPNSKEDFCTFIDIADLYSNFNCDLDENE